MKPEILLLNPSLAGLEAHLGPDLVAHRAWETDDLGGFLAGNGSRLRGLATTGAVDAELMARLPSLEIIAKNGVGYEHIDVGAALARGIAVTHTPDILTDEVADFAMGLVISTVRQIPAAERYLRSGMWGVTPFRLTGSLRGKTVGIAGMGRIGQAVATRCAAFGLEIAYHARTPKDTLYRYHPTIGALAADADILVVTLPGGPATDRMVGAETFAALGPDGVFVNVGRGSVVDQDALVDALASGRIAAAGLDVFEGEPHVPAALVAMDNVVLTPHVASASVHTRTAMARLVAENLLSWFSGNGPLTPIPEMGLFATIAASSV